MCIYLTIWHTASYKRKFVCVCLLPAAEMVSLFVMTSTQRSANKDILGGTGGYNLLY
jgi:hypothetical protein